MSAILAASRLGRCSGVAAAAAVGFEDPLMPLSSSCAAVAWMRKKKATKKKVELQSVVKLSLSCD
jgi:hypothetical protein